ncbi:MAG: MBL fold metallo-hydrolase [Chloroflexi bacterium]|nr:MBL fold metallo-hydrolase [Chloroflexota bacterium]
MASLTINKDYPIEGIETVPCRQDGIRGIVKAYLLHDDDQLVLVDTGASDLDSDLIVEAVDKIGRTMNDLSLVFLTHKHGDHVGGLKKLRPLADFPVVISEIDAPGMQEQTGVKADRIVAEGDSLPVLGGVKVIAMPGHTLGSLGLYVERAEAFIAGDSIVSAGGWLLPSPPFLSEDSQLARTSVQRMLDMGLKIDKVLMGHGDDVSGGAPMYFSRILAEGRG